VKREKRASILVLKEEVCRQDAKLRPEEPADSATRQKGTPNPPHRYRGTSEKRRGEAEKTGSVFFCSLSTEVLREKTLKNVSTEQNHRGKGSLPKRVGHDAEKKTGT